MSGLERVFQVLDQIADVLDPCRQPEQIGWTRRVRTFDRGAMLDQALDAANRSRTLPEPHMRCSRDRRALAALDANGEHAAEAALHLARRHRVTRKVGQSGIEHVLDERMTAEMFG